MENLHDALEYIPKYFKVISKADTYGNSDLVPMRLWKSQAYYITHRTKRDVILKSRQTGMSTGIEADNSHKVFTNKYTRMSIVTHDTETSEFLLQNIHRFHRHLPKEMKPKVDWASSSRIRFPIMDCYISIASANSAAVGIGHTMNIAHLSEIARWPNRVARQIFADITQTVPQNGFVTAESTPKGRSAFFYQLYDEAKKGINGYKAFFFPWWWDETCISFVELTEKNLSEAAERLNLAVEALRKEEELLIKHFDLSPLQIAFRRVKIKELGELFYQEYAENDIDCWLTSDEAVFDGIAIRRYLKEVSDGRISGDTTVWKDVIGGERYVIGVDVAAGTEKGDYSVASVLRSNRNEYVARIRGKIPPDIFTQEILRLGHRYNDAMIAVEKAQHGHVVIRGIIDAGYPNVYEHEDYDVSDTKTSFSPGWNTSMKTKPIMIDDFNTALRSGDIALWSENLMLEASSAIWEGSKMKCQGSHDDELIAIMIALQVRNQMPAFEKNSSSSYNSYISL